jgi:hypothetical protein
MDTNTMIHGLVNRIPVLRHALFSYTDTSVKIGSIRAAQQLTKKFHVRLRVHVPDETQIVLAHKACVVTFNHPYEIEPFLIAAALPYREKIKMVATGKILEVAPALEGHIVPVWVDHHADTEKKHKLSGFVSRMLTREPILPQDQAHGRNIKSIAQASRFVDSGGMVLIAPEGYRGARGTWFPGIAHLLTQIRRKRHVYYVQGFIRGTSNWDWFRLVPFINRILPAIDVYFSPPRQLSSFAFGSAKPRMVAGQLEMQYRTWLSSVERH